MLRTEWKCRSASYILGCLLVVGSPVLVVGQDSGPGNQEIPHGNVAEISDWALAGVVWSDASLAKKVAVAAAKQTKDKDRLDRLHQHVQRCDGIIEAMKEFGWKQLHKPAAAASGSATASSSATASPAAQGSRTGESSGLDLSGGESRYRESVAQAEAIDQGVENGPLGPAASKNIRRFSGLGSEQVTPRSVETLSDSLPYSSDSLYNVEAYDPSSMGAGKPAANNEVNTIVADEVNRLRASENQTLNTLERSPLPRTSLSQFTASERNLHADANWVQFQLDVNQLRWNKLAGATISDDLLADVLIQMNARMQLASQVTQNDQLRAAMAR